MQDLSRHTSEFPSLQALFFLRYQCSAAKRKIINSVGINHIVISLISPCNIPSRVGTSNGFTVKITSPTFPFIGCFPEYDATWVEELVESEMPIVTTLAIRVSELKGLGLIRVCVAAN
jgi:hypothetical protein